MQEGRHVFNMLTQALSDSKWRTVRSLQKKKRLSSFEVENNKELGQIFTRTLL